MRVHPEEVLDLLAEREVGIEDVGPPTAAGEAFLHLFEHIVPSRSAQGGACQGIHRKVAKALWFILHDPAFDGGKPLVHESIRVDLRRGRQVALNPGAVKEVGCRKTFAEVAVEARKIGHDLHCFLDGYGRARCRATFVLESARNCGVSMISAKTGFAARHRNYSMFSINNIISIIIVFLINISNIIRRPPGRRPIPTRSTLPDPTANCACDRKAYPYSLRTLRLPQAPKPYSWTAFFRVHVIVMSYSLRT